MPEPANLRGTGRTTSDMREAPRNAIFVWCNDRTGYPRDLAKHLGRTDLEIYGPSWLSGERWRGIERPVVIDHAAYENMSSREWSVLNEIRKREKQRVGA
jgi:hypothetical protein